MGWGRRAAPPNPRSCPVGLTPPVRPVTVAGCGRADGDVVGVEFRSGPVVQPTHCPRVRRSGRFGPPPRPASCGRSGGGGRSPPPRPPCRRRRACRQPVPVTSADLRVASPWSPPRRARRLWVRSAVGRPRVRVHGSSPPPVPSPPVRRRRSAPRLCGLPAAGPPHGCRQPAPSGCRPPSVCPRRSVPARWSSPGSARASVWSPSPRRLPVSGHPARCGPAPVTGPPPVRGRRPVVVGTGPPLVRRLRGRPPAGRRGTVPAVAVTGLRTPRSPPAGGPRPACPATPDHRRRDGPVRRRGHPRRRSVARLRRSAPSVALDSPEPSGRKLPRCGESSVPPLSTAVAGLTLRTRGSRDRPDLRPTGGPGGSALTSLDPARGATCGARRPCPVPPATAAPGPFDGLPLRLRPRGAALPVTPDAPPAPTAACAEAAPPAQGFPLPVRPWGPASPEAESDRCDVPPGSAPPTWPRRGRRTARQGWTRRGVPTPSTGGRAGVRPARTLAGSGRRRRDPHTRGAPHRPDRRLGTPRRGCPRAAPPHPRP